MDGFKTNHLILMAQGDRRQLDRGSSNRGADMHPSAKAATSTSGKSGKSERTMRSALRYPARVAALLFVGCLATSMAAAYRPVRIDAPQTPSVTAMRIARREGFFRAGTIPRRNHNPGDLMFNHQAGAAKGSVDIDGVRVARFSSDRDGWEALERQIKRMRDAGVPLRRAWAYIDDRLP